MTKRWQSWGLAFLLTAGCRSPVREHTDLMVAEIAHKAIDEIPGYSPHSRGGLANNGGGLAEEPVQQVSYEVPPPRPLGERLQIPRELPGAGVGPLELPRDPKQRVEAVDRLFPPLPLLGPDPEPGPGPDGQPVTLAQLQHLAVTNSPVLRQAAADVEAARGAAVQAGLYPNPQVGYMGTDVGEVNTAGYHGAFVEQVIKTGGKLDLAQASALMDVQNAELTLRKTQANLAAQVRGGYFAVLVARENMQATRALARFTDEVFRISVDQVRSGQHAPYEPMQERVLAIQARAALVQARNRYVSAWKQLAAVMGLPALPPAQLAGRADMPIPAYQYERLLAHVLTQHTDVQTAVNRQQKQRYELRLAQKTPVPDVRVGLGVKRTFEGPPDVILTDLTVGVPLPVWDRNQGGIRQAQGHLLRATEEMHRVRSDLTERLAAAFARYDNNRVLLDYYRRYLLPDQVRAYRGAYERHQQEPDAVGFGDVVNAQQILANGVTGYVVALGDMWSAVVDISNLLQTNDLFQVGADVVDQECLPPVPDLAELLTCPCCHPSSPLPGPQWKGGDGAWPPAAPEESRPRDLPQ